MNKVNSNSSQNLFKVSFQLCDFNHRCTCPKPPWSVICWSILLNEFFAFSAICCFQLLQISYFYLLITTALYLVVSSNSKLYNLYSTATCQVANKLSISKHETTKNKMLTHKQHCEVLTTRWNKTSIFELPQHPCHKSVLTLAADILISPSKTQTKTSSHQCSLLVSGLGGHLFG